jgi:hypothetical protein
MSNKKLKELTPEINMEFLKFQEDFCKVLDVFEHRGKKFTDDKSVRVLVLASLIVDIYAKAELDKKDFEFMKDRLVFTLLNGTELTDSEDMKDNKVLH